MFRLRNNVYLIIASCSLALAAYQSDSTLGPTFRIASSATGLGERMAKATQSASDATGAPLVAAATQH